MTDQLFQAALRVVEEAHPCREFGGYHDVHPVLLRDLAREVARRSMTPRPPTAFEARRRLLYQALELASLEVGPMDETNDATYDAAREYAEECLLQAAQEFVTAMTF